MRNQYDVWVTASLVDIVENPSPTDLRWWAIKRAVMLEITDGVFVMKNCEMLANGDFEAVGFAPVYIPKKCVQKYEKSKCVCL